MIYCWFQDSLTVKVKYKKNSPLVIKMFTFIDLIKSKHLWILIFSQ